MFEMLAQLSDGGDFFNLFRYITFRASGALMTSILIGFLLGPPMIRYLKRIQPHGQPIREIGPDHQSKSGTPTMGGILIIGALVISTLLWAELDNMYIWICLLYTSPSPRDS